MTFQIFNRNKFAKNSDVIPYIKKRLPKEYDTVLDLGCGMIQDGNDKKEDILSIFKGKDITGIDRHEPCIQWRENNYPEGDYILSDIRSFTLFGRKYDIVIAHHVLEHLNKYDSLNVLRNMEQRFTKLLIIGCPIGYSDTEYNVKLHNNPYERHLCSYMPEEFIKRGYEVIQVKNVFLAFKYGGDSNE